MKGTNRGIKGEFIQVVGELLGYEQMRLLEDFGLRYLHGELQALVLHCLAHRANFDTHYDQRQKYN